MAFGSLIGGIAKIAAPDIMSNLASGMFGLGSSFLGNAVNMGNSRDLMRDNYKYNLALQQNAQSWQEQMSNTAHQREVSDLRAAGINPILTATGGNGASTGSVGTGTVSNAGVPQMNPMQAMSEAVNMRNQTNATNADNQLKYAQSTHEMTKLLETRAKITKLIEETKNISGPERRLLEARIKEVDANIKYMSDLGLSAMSNARTNRLNYYSQNKVNESTAKYNENRATGKSYGKTDTYRIGPIEISKRRDERY
ncbi:DNA pilot protein [Dipodfec virus UOA04_Rod_753]|nr:DNA pilot protein [Dipodfec virus UOA04_Rod_753]